MFAKEKVLLKCRSSYNTNPVWQYRKYETSEAIPFDYQSTFGKFKPADNNSEGNYDLELTNAQNNDSGWYECIEHNDNGHRHVNFVLVGK